MKNQTVTSWQSFFSKTFHVFVAVFSATSNNNDNNDNNNNNNNNNNVGQFNNAFVSMNENAATATGGNGKKRRKKRMTGRSGDPQWEGLTRSIIRSAAEQMAESEVGLVQRYGEALLRS